MRYWNLDGLFREQPKAAVVPVQQRNVPIMQDMSDCGYESIVYRCPNCKTKLLSKIDGIFFGGRKSRYCPDCGIELRWER